MNLPIKILRIVRPVLQVTSIFLLAGSSYLCAQTENYQSLKPTALFLTQGNELHFGTLSFYQEVAGHMAKGEGFHLADPVQVQRYLEPFGEYGHNQPVIDQLTYLRAQGSGRGPVNASSTHQASS